MSAPQDPSEHRFADAVFDADPRDRTPRRRGRRRPAGEDLFEAHRDATVSDRPVEEMLDRHRAPAAGDWRAAVRHWATQGQRERERQVAAWRRGPWWLRWTRLTQGLRRGTTTAIVFAAFVTLLSLFFGPPAGPGGVVTLFVLEILLIAPVFAVGKVIADGYFGAAVGAVAGFYLGIRILVRAAERVQQLGPAAAADPAGNLERLFFGLTVFLSVPLCWMLGTLVGALLQRWLSPPWNVGLKRPEVPPPPPTR